MPNLKYTKELLQEAANNSTSVMGVMRYLGLAPVGGNHTYMSRRLEIYGVDTSHFTGQGHNKGAQARNRLSDTDLLAMLVLSTPETGRMSTRTLRRAMIAAGKEMKCACGLTSAWQGKPLVLEIDHIDRQYWNNRIENLRFLCPNCHSQA